jgi:hypothetical protein
MEVRVRTVLSAALLATALAAAAGCSGSPRPDPTPSVDRSSPPSTAYSGASLDCNGSIDTVTTLDPEYRNVLDAVAFQVTTPLQTSTSTGSDPHRLFAKTGLLVHTGVTATVTVPAAWKARLAITWGNHAAEWTSTLQTPACRQPEGTTGPWLAYPGGFSADKPDCYPLEIRSGDRTATVTIPIGQACPN